MNYEFLGTMGAAMTNPNGTLAELSILLQNQPRDMHNPRPDPGRPSIESGGVVNPNIEYVSNIDPISGLPILP